MQGLHLQTEVPVQLRNDHVRTHPGAARTDVCLVLTRILDKFYDG